MPPEQQTTLQLPVTTTAGSLTLFRWTSYDVPFWVHQNTMSGRWHVAGDPPTQYWSMTPDAAWAELIRAENLTREEELDELRMPLWVCRFPNAGLVDLTDPTVQSRFNVTPDGLTDDDWSTCQSIGRTVRSSCAGVISFSAALDGHLNVTLFGARRKIDWRARPALARATPAAVAALGRPPEGLIGQVRRRAAGSMPSLF